MPVLNGKKQHLLRYSKLERFSPSEHTIASEFIAVSINVTGGSLPVGLAQRSSLAVAYQATVSTAAAAMYVPQTDPLNGRA